MQNNFYPASYQPGFTQQTPYSNTREGIVWVQGLEGAKAYPVAAGNNMILMDSESSVFYIKSTDQSGIPQPLRIFDYTERKGEQAASPKEDMSEYVTKAEFAKVIAELRSKKGKKNE